MCLRNLSLLCSPLAATLKNYRVAQKLLLCCLKHVIKNLELEKQTLIREKEGIHFFETVKNDKFEAPGCVTQLVAHLLWQNKGLKRK